MKNRPSGPAGVVDAQDTVPLLDDSLPSYDSATAAGAASSSSVQSGHAQTPGQGQGQGHAQGHKPIPNYLFAQPAAAEPLSAEYPRLAGIDVKAGRRGKGMWVCDKRLHDRMSLS